MGLALRQLRESARWTQTQLGEEMARALGTKAIPQVTVSKWENGALDLRVSHVVAIADVFRVNPATIFERAGLSSSDPHEIPQVPTQDELQRMIARAVREEVNRSVALTPAGGSNPALEQSRELPPPLGELPRLLSVQQAATLLGFHRTTIYKMVKRGDFPAQRIGSQLRVSAETVRRVLEGGSLHRHAGA
jgi:excisionase family DNA binding protein